MPAVASPDGWHAWTPDTHLREIEEAINTDITLCTDHTGNGTQKRFTHIKITHRYRRRICAQRQVQWICVIGNVAAVEALACTTSLPRRVVHSNTSAAGQRGIHTMIKTNCTIAKKITSAVYR